MWLLMTPQRITVLEEMKRESGRMEQTGIQTVTGRSVKSSRTNHERRKKMAKRLTYAMVGGGPDGFIGDATAGNRAGWNSSHRGRGIFKETVRNHCRWRKALAFPRTGVMEDYPDKWPGLRGT